MTEVGAAPGAAGWPPVYLVSPFSNSAYLELLELALVEAGAELRALSQRPAAGEPFVVHVQWPDSFWSGGPLQVRRNRRRVARLLRALAMARSTGGRLVVTIHNLHAHDAGRPARWIQRAVLRRADLAVVLSPGGADRAVAAMPYLQRSRVRVAPLMDWGRRCPPMERDEAAGLVATPRGAGPLLAWFGLIRPYKGLERIADLLRRDPGAEVRFLVLGSVHRTDPALERALEVLAEDARVELVARRVSDEELRAACALADAAFLPFRDIENSASAMTALSAGCPVVVPDIGAMGDLRDDYGPGWVRTYAGDLDLGALVALAVQPRPARLPTVGHRSLPAVAEQHRRIYWEALSST